jgi:glutamyl-tRNA reductase
MSAVRPGYAEAPPGAALPPGVTGAFEPDAVPLGLVGLEFSLDTSSLDALEDVARTVTRARVAEWFSRLTKTEEAVLLSTCHRVELVLLVARPEVVEGWREVLPGGPTEWKLRSGRDVVRHLFRVAAGRESLAVGEGEVRYQVRRAGGSIESRHPRPVLRELFAGAAAAADELSPSVPNSRSIAAIAAARLLELVAAPVPHVLVVGSGTVGRQVTESLASTTRVTVVYHERPPDGEFLRTHGARAVPLATLPTEVREADAVVTAAKFGNHGLRASDLPRDRPLLLVDLGVPRNIDPGARDLPNVRLVDLEELHALSAGAPRSDDHDARVEVLADRWSERWEPRLLEPWIDTLRRTAEAVRRSELDRARPFLGKLEPSQEAAVERLTLRLVGRLMLPPTERLRSLPPGPDGDRQRRFAVELLRPRSADP